MPYDINGVCDDCNRMSSECTCCQVCNNTKEKCDCSFRTNERTYEELERDRINEAAANARLLRSLERLIQIINEVFKLFGYSDTPNLKEFTDKKGNLEAISSKTDKANYFNDVSTDLNDFLGFLNKYFNNPTDLGLTKNEVFFLVLLFFKDKYIRKVEWITDVETEKVLNALIVINKKEYINFLMRDDRMRFLAYVKKILFYCYQHKNRDTCFTPMLDNASKEFSSMKTGDKPKVWKSVLIAGNVSMDTSQHTRYVLTSNPNLWIEWYWPYKSVI